MNVKGCDNRPSGNRRQMQYLLDREIERFKRSGDPVSLMLMDLDHFKQLNDSRGHDAGDKVLQAFADILRQELRAQDLVARWGGEAFLVIMPQCTVSDALKTAERLRVALETYRGKSSDGADFEATVSIGVTDLRQGDDAVTAVSRADRAMYQSKELGQNRVTAVWVR